jgi:hypothetical protein
VTPDPDWRQELIACPPVLADSDALVAAVQALSTLLVCREGQVRHGMSVLGYGHARLLRAEPNQTRYDEVDHYGRYASYAASPNWLLVATTPAKP